MTNSRCEMSNQMFPRSNCVLAQKKACDSQIRTQCISNGCDNTESFLFTVFFF